MTSQAHEILILEGKKTSMMSCPSLPDENPHITRKSKIEISSTGCWRGYIGTWEIKNSQLFLIGLSGENYKLKEETIIFADWFSGELIVPEGNVLTPIHAGFCTVYEQEQRITIKRGLVVDSSLVDNRQSIDLPFAAKIEDFVEKRGIKSLVHFTKVGNIPTILEHGLLGRKTIEKNNINAEFNDKYRFENVTDAICVSISFPNYRMFYSLQHRFNEDDWAVIRLDPKILWEMPCAFYFRNAAANPQYKKSKNHFRTHMTLMDLQTMFGEPSPNIKRERLGIPDNYTTDPQAEVLVLESIGIENILDININVEGKINDIETIKNLFRPYRNEFKFLHSGSLFKYRKDYEFWKQTEKLYNFENTITF